MRPSVHTLLTLIVMIAPAIFLGACEKPANEAATPAAKPTSTPPAASQPASKTPTSAPASTPPKRTIESTPPKPAATKPQTQAKADPTPDKSETDSETQEKRRTLDKATLGLLDQYTQKLQAFNMVTNFLGDATLTEKVATLQETVDEAEGKFADFRRAETDAEAAGFEEEIKELMARATEEHDAVVARMKEIQ